MSKSKSREADAAASGKRFNEYLDRLAGALEHKSREASLRSYCVGLIVSSDRKSIEPIAERLTPDADRVSATHQSLHHFISNADWSDEALLDVVRGYALSAMTREAPISAWIIDDTGIPKRGKHSVGTTHQYCGQLGKQALCQTAVTLSIANEHASLPIAYQLYLPEEWAGDDERRKRTGVPNEISFQTKPSIALEQIRAACSRGVPRGVVLGDAAYGNDTRFREELSALNLSYAVGVQGSTTIWPPGTAPLPPKPWSGRGRKPTMLRRDAEHQPISVKQFALSLSAQEFRNVEWREGTAGTLSSRFAAKRVRAAHRETTTQRDEEWLLIEWPEGESEPTKFHLSTLPESTTIGELVRIIHLRWRIERDFQELKSELGLNHYEGRNWRGFHHHATMCIAAYGFLLAERGRFSPSRAVAIAIPDFSRNRRSRGSPEHSPTS
jgi:SRSO17 transposase